MQHGCCDETLTGPQPTAWRHSCQHVEMASCDSDEELLAVAAICAAIACVQPKKMLDKTLAEKKTADWSIPV